MFITLFLRREDSVTTETVASIPMKYCSQLIVGCVAWVQVCYLRLLHALLLQHISALSGPLFHNADQIKEL